MRMPDYRALKPLLDRAVHGEGVVAPDSIAGRVLRGARMGVLILVALVTLQSALLVAGAWRNDIAIERNMGWPPPRSSTRVSGAPPSSS